MLTQIEVTQRYSTKFQIAGRSVQQFSIYILTNRQRERFEKAIHRDSKASEKGTVNEIGSTNTNKEKRKWKNRLNFACRFDTWSMRCRNAFKIVHECDSHCFIYVLYYYYYYYYYYHHHHHRRRRRRLLSQAFSSWYFSWTSGDPHRSGFKLHTAVLSVLCVMFQV